LFSPSNRAEADIFRTTIEIKKHYFIPDKISIPANTRSKITIINHDNSAEEFESMELKREKIIMPKSKTIISLGPLKPGEYKFFGEFHEETAQGIIKVE
jgi:hypothetical protein